MDEKALLEAIGQIIDSKLEPIRGDLSGVRSKLEDVEQRVIKVELIQENAVAKQIQLLAESHIGIVEKLRGLDDLNEKVEDMQDAIFALKEVVFESRTQ